MSIDNINAFVDTLNDMASNGEISLPTCTQDEASCMNRHEMNAHLLPLFESAVVYLKTLSQ